MIDKGQSERLSQLLIGYVSADKDNPISGRRLAKLLGVNPGSANAYLDGVTFPKEETRKKIAKLLGLTYEALQAKIEDRELEQKLSVEEVCQEIQMLEDEDFCKVVDAVADEVARRLKVGD
jgi:transcriptional regulator with XRE-family HTH domain